MDRIYDKADMYRRLTAGELGNTITQYLSVDAWLASPDSARYPLWGVRSARHAMHPACRLNCPAAEVADHCRRHFADGPNISMMVEAIATVTAWLEVWDSPSGLVVEGVEHPDTAAGWTWRNSMRDPDRRKKWEGLQARLMLRKHLNPNSLADLTNPGDPDHPGLLERFPGHVVEMSCLESCLGSVPGRNGIVWEVRDGDTGMYELASWGKL